MRNTEALIKVGNIGGEFLDDLRALVKKYNSSEVKAAFALASIGLSISKPVNAGDENAYRFNEVSHKLEDMESKLQAYVNVLAAIRDPIAFDLGTMVAIHIAELMNKRGKMTEAETIEVARGLK